MSLDGAVLYNLKNEIQDVLDQARVDKIYQPSKQEIILSLRAQGENKKLIISANSSTPRIYFTKTSPENPQSPPMFCMLLRKHLSGSKFIEIRQNGMDRILFLDFGGYNDLGEKTVFTIVVEIMGRHSNIILTNESGKIIDAIKKIDFNTSSVRQVFPGMIYSDPPAQNKLNIITTSSKEIIERIMQYSEKSLSNSIMNTLEGFSPLPCREIAGLATGGVDDSILNIDNFSQLKLGKVLDDVRDMLVNRKCIATVVVSEDEKPIDFSFLPITQYGSLMKTENYGSFSEMLDDYYEKKEIVQRVTQQSSDLHLFLDNTIKRIIKRNSAQKAELEECKNRDELKISGELITANIHLLNKGDSVAKVKNYYDPSGAAVEIPLDIRKTPAQNAQHYFSRYRKAATAEKVLTSLIKEGEQEAIYIESVIDTLKRSQNSGDLEAIREELFVAGYLKKRKDKKRQKPQKQPPYEYISSDGFKIHAGRNNTQNDKLTLKDSSGEDMWLHTQKIPGSHVIIFTNGKELPQQTLLEAASIAAYHSKASDSKNVPVDYAKVRYVKKPSGAKPGMVIYNTFSTVFVDPDENLLNMLSKEKRL